MQERFLPGAVEKLTPRSITPMEQRLRAGCVPTSISMVFSGFGINISEQALVEKYFPTVKLPITDPKVGVSNIDTVRGIIQIIKDLGLGESLQLDVFIPGLSESRRKSSEKEYIVKAKPQAVGSYGKGFEKGSDERAFFETLEQLAKVGEIGVYTANAKLMQFAKNHTFWREPAEATEGFYRELSSFISKGHIVGPHGGMTRHTRTLDGSKMVRLPNREDEKGYLILDPIGRTYPVSLQSLVMIDSFGVRGDVFDYLFRVSPREETLKSQKPGLRRFIPNFRG